MALISYEQTLLSILVLIFAGFYIGISVPLLALYLGVVIILIHMVFYEGKNFTSFFMGAKKLFSAPIFILGVLTLLSFGVSSLMGIKPQESFIKWVAVCFIAAAGLVWYLGLRNVSFEKLASFPRYIYFALIALSFIYLVEILIWKFTGHTWHSDRFFLTMRKLSSIYAILTPFALLYILQKNKVTHWSALFLISTVVFFCGGRSGEVSFVFMVVLFAFFFPWRKLSSPLKSGMGYAASLLLGAVAGSIGYLMMVGEKDFIRRVASPEAVTGSGRTDIWQFSWDRITEHPFFGIGIQGFRYLDFTNARLSSIAHPHNVLIELVLEVGFIGTALLAGFVCFVLYKAIYLPYKEIPRDQYELRSMIMAVTVSLCAYFLSAQFLTSFFHGWWLTYPTTLMALIGTFAHFQNKELNVGT